MQCRTHICIGHICIGHPKERHGAICNGKDAKHAHIWIVSRTEEDLDQPECQLSVTEGIF